uniref:Uncharacterized protein n=1 Tax=Leersia perrieri TaxID=77586 RepID=A0A0D9VG19_9ORYZ
MGRAVIVGHRGFAAAGLPYTSPVHIRPRSRLKTARVTLEIESRETRIVSGLRHRAGDGRVW